MWTGNGGHRRLAGVWRTGLAGGLALLALALAGCGVAESDNELRSVRERAEPRAAGSDLGELANGNASFAWELYRELSSSEGNLFYSPYSISVALAMTYAGAGGDTAREMSDALRFSLPPERLHPSFNALSLDLDARTGGAGGDSADFRLEVVNAVWGQEGHPFLDAYLDLLAEHYGAGVRLTDFRGSPEESREVINQWVSGQTEDRIEDLIPPGIIDALTRMVLVNAVYFKASWLYPFDERETAMAPFHLLDGSAVEASMMRTTDYFGYAAGDGYQAVELPYAGGDLSMIVLLPDQGRFKEFEERLDAGHVGGLLAEVGEGYVALEMPRFEFEADFLLGDTLSGMGMSSAFDVAAADFSGMDGRSCRAGDDGCLYVREAVHKAFVSVDEAGTEAAAATAVVMTTESAKPRPVSVTVDRPFVFLIRDRATGTILFVGRVLAP